MSENPKLFRWRFLEPRFWSRWLLFAGMAMVARLPYSLAMQLGRALGGLGLRLAGERRQIAEINLELCFPELSEAKRGELLRQHFESLGMAAAETSLCWWGSPRKLRGLLREIEGEEHLKAVLEQGKGALLLSPHFTHLEIGISLLAADRPTAAVYKPHKNPLF